MRMNWERDNLMSTRERRTLLESQGLVYGSVEYGMAYRRLGAVRFDLDGDGDGARSSGQGWVLSGSWFTPEHVDVSRNQVRELAIARKGWRVCVHRAGIARTMPLCIN